VIIVRHSPDSLAIPFFSFEDAGARSLIAAFAANWGDVQATEGWHSGLIVDVDGLEAQGLIEARAPGPRGPRRQLYAGGGRAWYQPVAGGHLAGQ
jgi:hypothetical protein